MPTNPTGIGPMIADDDAFERPPYTVVQAVSNWLAGNYCLVGVRKTPWNIFAARCGKDFPHINDRDD